MVGEITCMFFSVQSCRDGFLFSMRSYLRAWDRGIAVIVPTLLASAAAVAAEPSGRLAAGVELLETALTIAEDFLPSVRCRWYGMDGIRDESDRSLSNRECEQYK